jgi:hypothetical protein
MTVCPEQNHEICEELCNNQSLISLVRKVKDVNEHETIQFYTNQSKGTALVLPFYISQSL